jgi:hypothetical protein
VSEFARDEAPRLTPEAIREFVGLADPELKDRLAPLARENSVRRRRQARECWIETPRERPWAGAVPISRPRSPTHSRSLTVPIGGAAA